MTWQSGCLLPFAAKFYQRIAISEQTLQEIGLINNHTKTNTKAFRVNFTSSDTSRFKCFQFHFILRIFNRTFHNFPRPSVMHHFRCKLRGFHSSRKLSNKRWKRLEQPSLFGWKKGRGVIRFWLLNKSTEYCVKKRLKNRKDKHRKALKIYRNLIVTMKAILLARNLIREDRDSLMTMSPFLSCYFFLVRSINENFEIKLQAPTSQTTAIGHL